jgi:hypothetical protein
LLGVTLSALSARDADAGDETPGQPSLL